jgi:hypothetical protein
MKQVQKYSISYHIIEPHQTQQNRVETAIWEVKKQCWFRQMVKCKVPKRLWDYGIMWACKIMSLTSYSMFSVEGCTRTEQHPTHQNIWILDSNWIWFKENVDLGKNKLSWWLGMAHQVGNLMLYWIYETEAGQVISWTIVQCKTNLELTTDEVKQRCKVYDQWVHIFWWM